MLGFDFDRGAGFDGIPHLIHVPVAEGNTPVCPVEALDQDRKPPIAVLLTVDHDVTAGIDTALPGLLAVFFIRV